VSGGARAGRILHGIPTMAGGGAERQLAYLATELHRIGWEVHVALMRRGPNWSRLCASGAVVHELPVRSAYDPRILVRLHRLIARTNPDVVQTWLLQMDVLGGLAALIGRKPWIVSERASREAYAISAKTVMRRGMAQAASAIVSNSAAGDAYWRDHVHRRVRRYTVSNGVPIAEVALAPAVSRAALGIDARDPVVLFAGRLAPQKNLDVLMSALSLVFSRRVAHVLCCGEGPLRGQLERWIAGHERRSRVRMLGYVPNLWSLMKSATLLVSPSLFDGHPNVVLEAMACGVPLVVSDIPEHREIVDERSALLVDPRSVEGLARAIEAVMDDPGAAAARAAAAKARVEHYDLGVMAKQYSDIYLDVLSEWRRR
jgi:glycosyltransferase involved in cell wall biosynthesis